MKGNATIGIYWGSFDPPTRAHKAIIEAALQKVDKLIVVVNDDRRKQYFISAQARCKLLQSSLKIATNQIDYFIQCDNNRYDYHDVKELYAAQLIAVVGEDSYALWKTKASPQDFQQYDGIIVVPRRSQGDLDTDLPDNVMIMKIDAKYDGISSKQARHHLAMGNIKQIKESLDTSIVASILEQYKLETQ